MGLRLILVSAVAGLGLSLPNTDDLNAWALRVQDWMIVKLAEWDAPYPNEGGAFVFAADAFDSTAIEPAPAAAPSVQAIPEEEDGAGFDAILEEIVKGFPADPTPVPPAAKEILVENPTDVDETPKPGPDFDEIQEEVVAGFLADLAPAQPASEPAVATVEPGSTPAEAPKGDSPEESDELYEGLAYSLNREAEGIAVDQETNADASRTEQWVHALRLTREAVFAWANLLHGPAVVTIEH
jgi:hypothetical protein